MQQDLSLINDDDSSSISKQSNYAGPFARAESSAQRQHKSVRDVKERVSSVTGEQFKHIVYYPIFDVQDEAKIVAVLEVGFKKRKTSQHPLLTEDMQSYLDQFRSHLSQFKVRLSSFSKALTGMYQRRHEKRVCQLFQRWKQATVQLRYRERFAQN